MNWLALGATQIPKLYGFVISVNSCEKFISCLSSVAKSLIELLQKGKKWVTGVPGHGDVKQCVVQLHEGLCILILLYLWPCLVVPSSWDQELWSHTDCQMAAGSPECLYWQTVGKKQPRKVIARCQHRGNELEPRENIKIPAKTGNPCVSRGCRSFPNDTSKNGQALKCPHNQDK